MIEERELALARKIAARTAARWTLAEAEDVASELVLWLYQNESTVDRYRTEPGGEGKLFTALRRTANRYAAGEQEARQGGVLEPASPYTVAQIERAIPFIFEPVPEAIVHEVNGRAVSTLPNEYGLAAAVILDIREAFERLSPEARTVLTLHYRDGLPYRSISHLVGISESGVKKRARRALSRMRVILADGAWLSAR